VITVMQSSIGESFIIQRYEIAIICIILSLFLVFLCAVAMQLKNGVINSSSAKKWIFPLMGIFYAGAVWFLLSGDRVAVVTAFIPKGITLPILIFPILSATVVFIKRRLTR